MMKLPKIISSSLLSLRLNLSEPKPTLKEAGSNDKKRLSYAIRRQKTFYATLGQDELKQAIVLAEEPENPVRYYLYEIYKEVLKDFHLRSQIRTAIFKIIKEPWAVVDAKTKTINKEATELLQKKWFQDITQYVLEAEYWGHSLIEFGQLTQDAETNKMVFKDVILFPREHVSPEKGMILLNPSDISGLYYREEPYNKWLIETPETHDLGLLHVAARYSIYKKFAYSDWSRSGEKWGDPLLVIRSASSDDKENDKKEEFAANFGSNGYAILDKDDEIELLERKNEKGYEINKFFAEAMDKENSKGINGQTATADEKSFVGSAEVQERILDDLTEARIRSLYYFHNDVTLPYLINCNGGNTAYSALKGMSWMPLEYLKEPGTDGGKTGEDPNSPAPKPKPKPDVKKKPLRLV
ncbi:MAG: DUF935 family protein [Candidatus Kapaibacterium sp.]|nr:MAG: DUF935 family protein [Candidatus Kapabacteria bacterium]